MSPPENEKPRIAIITLIQEGVVKVGGEHAMLFPYVEQAIKAAETVKDKIEVIPYVISPRPKKLEKLPRVEDLRAKLIATNNGAIILVSNGASGPYANPWNWEKFGHEAHKAILRLIREDNLQGIVVIAHGFASIPAVLNLIPSKNRGLLGKTKMVCYAITHSTFDEHKDDRPQRRLLEREISRHAGMIAISPYMASHLEEIAMVERKEKTIPLYNALPESGWFSNKVSESVILQLIEERNNQLNKGPFYGTKLPIDEILAGEKELVLYFGRAQKYVKGTDAVIACAKQDKKRHYLLICSGSNDELVWHKTLIKNLKNVTLAWEHNSQLVLGIVQLTEGREKMRITTLFLSRREPMGLVSREVILMQKEGSVLPVVADNCGFADPWQEEFSFLVTNPRTGEENQNISFTKLAQQGEELFISPQCIKETLAALDIISHLSTDELRKRVKGYAAKIRENYSQDRYWAFYLQTLIETNQELEKYITAKLSEYKLQKLPNIHNVNES